MHPPPGTTDDTIAAIATPPGRGAIGIVRISGSNSLPIFKQLFHPRKQRRQPQSHHLAYGHIITPEGEVLDEVLAVYMRAPATYTREDVVEIHSHSSYVVLEAILETVFRCGARPAEPGEFTKRAFLAGRIDLTRAEAVIDLLRARTRRSAALATSQLSGRLQQQIEAIRRHLLQILAHLEVALDFPDEDLEIINPLPLAETLRTAVEQPLARLIHQGSQGKIIREGFRVVIAGAPNVGKSSLLNALLDEERALVTAIPGTTRDTIEETISIQGIPIHIIDTAGIRRHADQIEELGIARSRRKMAEADLVLFLVDASAGLTTQDQELYQALQELPRLVVLNKQDLVSPDQLQRLVDRFDTARVVITAARTGTGLEKLRQAIYDQIAGNQQLGEPLEVAPNRRHLLSLERALVGCQHLLTALDRGATFDLLAVDIQDILDHLGEIVGLTTTDDVLDLIFKEFCLGK